MKNFIKIFCILICLSFFLTAFSFKEIDNVTADPPTYAYEGSIVDDDGVGIEGMYVTITNLETSEDLTIITDEDGLYSVDFTELEWNPQFDVQFETTNGEELGYYDIIFYIGVVEGINVYVGTTTVKRILNDEEIYIYSIYCGSYHLTEYSGGQSSDPKDSDEKQVESDLQRRIQPGFDTYFDYTRLDTNLHSFTNYIFTQEQTGLYPKTSKFTENFTTPKEDWYTLTTHSDDYYKWPGAPSKRQMVSENGIICEIQLNGVWQPDGNGAFGHCYEADFI
jgi:hypothetical protein